MLKQSQRKGFNNSWATKSSKASSHHETRHTSTRTENEHPELQTPASTTVTTQHAVLPVSSSNLSDGSRTLTLNDVSAIVQQVIKSLPQLQGQQPALLIQLAPTSVHPSEPVFTLAQETAPTTITCSGTQGVTLVMQSFTPVIATYPPPGTWITTEPHTTWPPD